ncbi:thyroid adenoma-associated protein homolog [Actinia tenebrosa]|uniref:Thyroid adenoma-associated protein homolog n=1 Tax=Actinia tenebrosa TaxID=6105 RepID=A0A6P8IAA9_ACTTE|nr:thyroid adenoma-associated protein homolog [Actinia tenebrosa]
MDKQFSLDLVLRKLDDFKEKSCKHWLTIYTILGDLLRQSAQKKRMILLDRLHVEVSNLRKFSTKNEGEVPHDQQCLQEFARLMSEMFASNILCPKMNQRIIKIIQSVYAICPDVTKEEITKQIDAILSSESEDNSTQTLQNVIIIVESWSLGRQCIEEKFEKVLEITAEWCDKIIDKLEESRKTNIVNYQDTLLLVIKAVLQMFQHFSSKFRQLSQSEVSQAKQELKTLISLLVCVLFSKILVKECLLLAGTALSLLLNSETDESQVINTIIQLLDHTEDKKSPSAESVITICNLETNLPVAGYSPLTRITILHAFITTSRKEILLHDAINGRPFLVSILFGKVHKICKEEINPVIHYLAYEVIKSLMHRIKQLLEDICQKDSQRLFGCDSIFTSQILEHVWDSLEDPVEGVSIAGRGIFGLFLDVHDGEHYILKDEETFRAQFYESIVDKVLAVPWQVKTRYGLICELLPHVTLEQVFNKRPSLLEEMAYCLKSNQLSSASTEAFKTLLLHKRTGKIDSCGSQVDKPFNLQWKNILLKSLTSENPLLAQHTRQYWLPCVLKNVPDALDQMLRDLHSNGGHQSRVVSAHLAILKAARSLGVMESKQLDEELLTSALEDAEDTIRLDALGVLSCSSKTSESLSEIELGLLRNFLCHNLNIACPSFRQDLFVAMRKILSRIRDSCLSELKRCYPKIFKNHSLGVNELQALSVQSDLVHALEFVEWTMTFMVNSLLPGANYQRQKTALELISIIFDTFAVKGNPDKRKGQAPESTIVLMKFSEAKGLWSFYSPRNIHVLLGCLQSSHSDIRELSLNILRHHFSGPLTGLDKSKGDSQFAVDLMNEASQLICSPKAQESESGAVICQLLFERYVVLLDWEVKDIFSDPSAQSQRDADSKERGNHCVQFLSELLAEAERQLSSAKDNIAVAAEKYPIHGILLTLCRCISSYLDTITCPQISQPTFQSFKTILQRTVQVTIEVIDFLLGVLSRKQDSENVVCGASFAGLGEAVEDAISVNSLTDDTTLSQQHQKEFIMSCCFLSIKFGCQLLSNIVEKVSSSGSEDSRFASLLPSSDLTAIGEIFIKIFTHCRLTGILLSCKVSLTIVSRRLSESSIECVYSLPRQWIRNVIDSISGQGAASSVTRRSAGLPVLVVNILASESPNKRQQSVKYCLDKLLNVAFKPIPEVVDQTTDLPQVHAMNILRLLYQDTALGNDVLCYTEQGLVLAVQGFASPLWSIRNAATQLFGSLVLRVLGHKRGLQDENQFNSISARDFFKRFSSLRSFFLEQLRSFSSDTNTQPMSTPCTAVLKPELFPILTLFSKLRPATSDIEESLLSDFIPFLTPLSSSPVYAVRSLAAQALVPFIPIEGFVRKAVELLTTIPSSPQSVSQNTLHGTLLQVHHLVDAMATNSHVTIETGLVLKELQNRLWLGTDLNPCALTKAEYLNILMELAPMASKKADDDLRSLIEHVTLKTNYNYPVQVGLPYLHRALSASALDLVTSEFWSEGSEDSNYSSVIKTCLHSKERETRIASLGHLHHVLQNKTRLTRHDLDEVLTSLITMETDQQCLLLALDCFNDVCTRSDEIMLKGCEQLWVSLLSFTRGSRGSSVQSKAITALSILVYFVFKNLVDQSQMASMATDWSKAISECSMPGKPEPVRNGAARGLGIAGEEVLHFAEKRQGKEYQNLDKIMETAVRIFKTGIMLLEDEQDDVRIAASHFGAKIRHRHGNVNDISSITCSVAITSIFEYMSRVFWWSPPVWVTMVTILHGRCSVMELLTEYTKSRHILFEQEDCNLYAEPFITAQLSCRHLKLIADQISSSKDEQTREIKKQYQEWLQSEAQRLLSDIKTLKNSGIKDTGSLQSPKMFTLRYRLVMMGDVIAHVISSLGNSSLPINDSLKQEIKTLLSDVGKNSVGSHPILHESTFS